MAKTLATIVSQYPIQTIHGDLAITIEGIQVDSRKIRPNELFVAVKGAALDGHQFIGKALENGATAIVCEALPSEIKPNITYLQVADSAEALGVLGSTFYEYPSNKLKLVAVTGTNGKTTTATLLYNLFKGMGYNTGLLSTVENRINEEVIDATLTTPDALTMNRLLAKMVEAGCEYCFMEASSHAIVQKRIAGIKVTGAIFTNITRDHLDYHKTFANYINAKKLLFDGLPKTAFALINRDDKRGKVMLQNCKAKHYTYGIRSMADFKAKLLESSFQGLCLEIENTEVWFQLMGEFNAYNLLTAYATAIILGETPETVLGVLSAVKTARGRLERVPAPNQITALVDYAHTPDALENVLETIVAVRKKGQRIITVVGCGGNRDKGKRPIMAKVATELSDFVWLTSDNPRSENPVQILKDMEIGVAPQFTSRTIREVDRKKAIYKACQSAQAGDVILVAGKGHETYQEIKGERFPFDDKKVIQEAFQSLSNTQYADSV